MQTFEEAAVTFIEDHIDLLDNDEWVQFFDICPYILKSQVFHLIEDAGIKIPDFEYDLIGFFLTANSSQMCAVNIREDNSIEVAAGGYSSRSTIICKNIMDAIHICDKCFGLTCRILQDTSYYKYHWVPCECTFGPAYVSQEWIDWKKEEKCNE